MENFLVMRKEDNSEFEIKTLKKENEKVSSWINAIKEGIIKKAKDKIISDIETKKCKYFTKSKDKSDSAVEVVDGENGKYLRSIANDGISDNINELPIYK